MLLSQPHSTYQLAEISLDAGHANDITCMLLDVHTVLDHLWLDGTQPQASRPAEQALQFTNSPYTLPGLIAALDQVTTMLAHAARDAVSNGRAAAASDPGYTHPAIDALTQAASTETDFADWLAHVLATAAAQLGSSDALTSRRPGSWEASLLDQLVKGTIGYHDELLPNYTGHTPST
jgi:hypothetical protein